MWAYLLHFDKPICATRTTQHYLGVAEDVEERLQQHKAGRGAKLTRAAVERGIDFHIVQVWQGDRTFERYLKSLKAGPRLCPLCGVRHRLGMLHVPSYNPAQLEMDFDDAWTLPTQARAAEIDAYRAFRANRRTSFALGDTSGIIPF